MKEFDSDDSGSFEKIGDLSENSFDHEVHQPEMTKKERFNHIGFDCIDEMEGVMPQQSRDLFRDTNVGKGNMFDQS